MREIRPLSEDLRALGFTDDTPGGNRAFEGMVRLMGIEVTESTQEPAKVADAKADAKIEEAEDPFDGPSITEELLERLESIDFDSISDDLLEDLLEALSEKTVSEDLEDRTRAVIDEMKKVRIVGGKVTRVNVRRGSKAMRQKRKRRMEYKRHRAAIKIKRQKRERKAGAKIKAAKTARKRESLFGALKKAIGGAGKKLSTMANKAKKTSGLMKAESTSPLARELFAMLKEDSNSSYSIRDEMIVRLGDILVLVDRILEDEEVSEMMAEQYEKIVNPYCDGSLTESKLDDAAFYAQIAPVVRLSGKCIDAIAGNV